MLHSPRWSRILVFALVACMGLASMVRADPAPTPATDAEATATAETGPLMTPFSDAYNAGDYAKALEILRKALAIWLARVGPRHPTVGSLRINIAEMLRQLGRLDEAATELQTAIAVLSATAGPAAAQTLVAQHNLGAVRMQQGKVKEALELLEKTEAALVQVHGSAALEVAQARMHIADAQLQLGRLEPARAGYTAVMAVLDAPKPPSPEHLAIALNNRAKLHRALGDLPAAEKDLARAAQILGQLFGLGHPTLALAAINIAELRLERGELALAEEALRQAIQVSAARLGKGHPQVAAGALLLANLYRARGEFDRAKGLYADVLDILEKAFGAEHQALAEALNHAGVLALHTGDDAVAHQHLDRAWKILLKPETANHPLRPLLAQNLAVVLERAGGTDEARRLLEQAIAACDKLPGKGADCGAPRYNLALMDVRVRRYADAEKRLHAALGLRVQNHGQLHPEVARTLVALASVQDAQGRGPLAAGLLEQATAIRERQLALALSSGAEGPKRLLVATLAQERDFVLDILLRADRPSAAWELVVQRKGRALDAMVDGLRGAGADPKAQQELAQARGRLAALYGRGPAGQSPELHTAALQEATRDAEEAERKVVARIGAVAASTPVRVAQAQAQLPDKGALLEFVVRTPVRVGDASSAVKPAVVTACLVAKTGDPVCRDLGPAETLEPLAMAVRKAASASTGDVDSAGRPLAAALFTPFAAQLRGVEHLVLAPDGALHLLPFAALPDAPGKRLLDRFALSYLTSGRDLVRLGATAAARGPAVFVGAPAYDGAPDVAADKTPAAASGSFTPLPGTLAETTALAALWPGAQLWTDVAATERAVKAVAGPAVLHIATHGYFHADKADAVGHGTRGGRRGAELLGDPPVAVMPTVGKDDPLLRSGIALAGANRPSAGDQDGILSALELAGLDLAGTRLAVLSACDTGIGDVRQGEGVFGLRRALVLAGAQTQVISLWKVDDEATRDLMVAMYRAMKGDGKAAGLTRVEALRQAQRALAADGKRGHPYYWAAFILSGQWGKVGL